MRRNPRSLALHRTLFGVAVCLARRQRRPRRWGVAARFSARRRSTLDWMARWALFAGLAGPVFFAFPLGAAPVELDPCPALQRQGVMNEDGVVSRPVTPQQLAADMARLCEYAVLGRFVSVADSHYDKLLDGGANPVVAKFEVVEVLRGEAVAVASIRLTRDMLAAPGQSWSDDVNRYATVAAAAADDVYRQQVAAEVERELASLLESGEPMTNSQHERLVATLRTMVWLPTRTRYEQHQLVNERFASDSPLNFYSELGGIHPDEVYLVGLSRKAESPSTTYFGPLHTFLFWGQEAQDIAAALRKRD